MWAGQRERCTEPVRLHTGRASGSFTVPAGLTAGLYNVYIDEANTTPLMGNGPNDAYQTASGHSLGTDEATTTVNVVDPPTITSGNSASTAEGDPFTFAVTTSSAVTPVISKSAGSLPTGITLVDNGNGTATLAGSAGTGTQGTYNFTIKADTGLPAAARRRPSRSS